MKKMLLAKGRIHMDINQKIIELKTEAIFFVQDLHDSNKNEIDKYKLAELKSNLEALITIIDREMKSK